MTRRLRAGRGGRGRGGRGGSGALAPLRGLSDLTVANYAQTEAPGGVGTAAAPYWVGVLASITSQAASATRVLLASNQSSSGWEFRTNGFNATAGFYSWSGSSGALVASPLFTVTAGHVNKELLLVGVHDGTVLRLYADALEVASGTAITGYTPHVGRMRAGQRPTGTLMATDVTLYGWAGGHAAPSLAQVVAYFAAVKAARRMVSMAGVTTQSVWNVTDVVSVLDSVGVDHMPVTGTPTLVTKATPTWSW